MGVSSRRHAAFTGHARRAFLDNAGVCKTPVDSREFCAKHHRVCLSYYFQPAFLVLRLSKLPGIPGSFSDVHIHRCPTASVVMKFSDRVVG